MHKEYWENRYTEEKTGWDVGYVTTPLKTYFDQLQDKSLKILIPGAGNGHEAAYLFENGFGNVYILDIAKQPLEKFQERFPVFPKDQILCQDFFSLNNEFDLIIEHTFFCALLPNLREQYVLKMFQLLRKTGTLAGLLFNIPLQTNEPPFGGTPELYQRLFTQHFHIEILETSYNSIKPRTGKELFFKLKPKK